MSAPKLYTDGEVRQAIKIGMGMGQVGDAAATEKRIGEAMELFAGGHGRVIPNYAVFKELAEKNDYGGLARAHLAAGLMSDGDAVYRHAALGQLAALIELDGTLGYVGNGVERCAGRA